MESQPSGPEILAAIIKEFLLNSKCATEDQQKAYLLELLGNKKLVTTLLYRGSEHGWTAADFHSRCDNKGPTVSLFKVRDGDCIGGYTKAQWSSSEAKFVGDSAAMLFNLSCRRHFPTKGVKGQEILCNGALGPDFTGGHCTELGAPNEPFNEGQCVSCLNEAGYGIPVDANGINTLTNKEGEYFTISELEVWEVKTL